MIKLLTAIAVVCVAVTGVGIIYCYIKGTDPAEIGDEDETGEVEK